MKLEREPLFGHVNLSHKPDSKSFDYDELSLDSNGVKSEKLVKETQNGHSHDFKDKKNVDDQLLYLTNDGNSIASSKLDCFDKDYQSEDILAPFAESSPEIESLRNDPDFYTDKSAVECEMPELQVCYRDSNYSSVKDICVDDGVCSKDKLVFEDSADKKSLCTFVFPDQDLDKDLEEECNIGVVSPNGFKSLSEKISDTDFVCVPKDLMPTSQEDCDTQQDKLGNDILQQAEIIILTEEMEPDNPRFRTPVSEASEVPQVQISSDNGSEDTTRTMITGPKLNSEKFNSTSFEASAVTAPNSAAEEPSLSSSATELPYSSTVEKRRITFNFDSSMPEITAKEAPQNGDPECHDTDDKTRDSEIASEKTRDSEIASEKTRDGPEIEEISQTGVSGSFESPKTSSVDGDSQNVPTQFRHFMAREDNPHISDSGHLNKIPEKSIAEDGLLGSQFVSGHYQFGESSFSAAGPLSGRITYSGPIPYSGSISVRSDSSTTSTRSFAFPVLQNEWNSSPVRMAKADRRRFRKHRGWRHGILCCRF